MKFENDHLEPVDSIFNTSDISYQLKLRKNLFKNLNEFPVLNYIKTPSFDPESMIAVERYKGINNYSIIYQQASESIWFSRKDDVEVHVFRKKLEFESFQLLELLFKSFLKQTRYHINQRIVLDGVEHSFFCQNQSGQIHSPDEDSNTGRLVEICFKLKELILNDKTVLQFNDELKNEIKDLIKIN